MNGLDDESHLLDKGRSSTNEVDWSHVPTKRKKPTKRKVFNLFLFFSIKYFNFNLGEKRTTISNNTTTTTTTTTTIKTIG